MQTIERELADLIDEATALIDLYDLEVVDFFDDEECRIHDECRAMLDKRA